MEKIELIVLSGGERVDAYVCANTDLSRSHVQKLIKNGSLTVNEQNIRASYRLETDDLIVIKYEKPKPVDLKPMAMPLDIVYEDHDLIVINKPKGLVVHPGAGNYDYTLVHGLLAHCHDLSGINGELRPGIVHRIDKDTSGLLVCAKNDDTHIALSAQLADKTCYRRYLAIAWGVFAHDEGIIDAPIGRDPKDRQRMCVTDKNAKEAVTEFKVLQRFDDSTLVRLNLKTGRTHQIRAHLKYIHHPIVNDSRYSNRPLIDDSGQYLHAYYLSFIHPRTRKRMEFKTAMPSYMLTYCANKGVSYEQSEL